VAPLQPAPAPEPKQLPFTFMALVKKTGSLPKSSRSRTIDPLTAAKTKIINALSVQEGFVQELIDGTPLPKRDGGAKTVNTWFSKQSDGWWTSIRYGQVAIPIDGTSTDMLIGELKDVLLFYGAVKIAMGKGELDGPIGELQTKKSAALSGKNGTSQQKAAKTVANAFDTLGYDKRLRDAGFSMEQAEAHAEAARKFINGGAGHQDRPAANQAAA
jgi:hypothetical protein